MNVNVNIIIIILYKLSRSFPFSLFEYVCIFEFGEHTQTQTILERFITFTQNI